ncbi:MAG: T9SS type A sorting domain-containing protein [Flavobacteriaceae bacterium]|nr:T9SS type A sorting domain-containing protein [Flavobacteriaceae bacterium]
MKQIYLTLLVALPMLLTAQETESVMYPLPQKELAAMEIEALQLYPNPVTNNVVHITTKTNNAKDVIVFDVFGNVVLRQKLYQKTLDLSSIRKGVYIIQIVEGNRKSKRKLVIK